jgi:myosin protein heavy chain
MSSNSGQRRNNPFARTSSPSPSPGNSHGRQKSIIMSSPLSSSQNPQGHNRDQSFSSIAGNLAPNNNSTPHARSNSKNGTPTSNTFAPSFIKSEERRSSEVVKGIEGENDFSGKRYVWLKDPQTAFVRGWIVEELGNNQILVQCDDGSVCSP